MNAIKETGGAQIGRRKASFPWAKLTVDHNTLELQVNMIGTMRFSKSDIVSINSNEKGMFIGSGIEIVHNVMAYEEKIIFLPTQNGKLLLEKISQIGFVPSGSNQSKNTSEFQETRPQIKGFAFKTSVVILFVIFWNILFLSQLAPMFLGLEIGIPYGIRIAFGGLICLCILTLLSSDFRRIILKEGRDLSDVKYGILFILGLATLFFTVLTVIGF